MTAINHLRDEAICLSLISRITRLADEHYVRATVRGMFGFVRDWMDLSTEQLEQLHTTIVRRKAKQAARQAAAARQQKFSFRN